MNTNHPTIDMAATGKNIKHIMRVKGLSVRDVQKYLSLGTPQSVYHWLDGKSMPTLDNFYALSQLFQIPIDDIIQGNKRNARFINIKDSVIRLSLYHSMCKLVYQAN